MIINLHDLKHKFNPNRDDGNNEDDDQQSEF